MKIINSPTKISIYNMAKLFLSGNFVLVYNISSIRTYQNHRYTMTFEEKEEEFKMDLREDGIFIFRVWLSDEYYQKLLALKHETSN